MGQRQSTFTAVLAALALTGCASTAMTPDRSVVVGEAIRAPVPADFRVREVTGFGGDGTEIRRYRRGRETGDLCTFRVVRQESGADPEVFAASLVDRRLAAAASSGVRDAVSGAEPASPGGPGRRYVTASFSLHSTIYVENSYWVWRDGPDLVSVSRSCQSSTSIAARRLLADALQPIFIGMPGS